MLEHLPQDNPVFREINGPWDDKTRLLHSIDSGIRSGNASFYNANRPKGQSSIKPEFLPTPEQRKKEQAQEADPRSVEQIVAEREHLLKVVNRPRSRKALTS